MKNSILGIFVHNNMVFMFICYHVIFQNLQFPYYRVNPGKYGQRYKYGQRATNAHTKASLGCDSNASISPIICTFGFFAECILLDSVPLK